MVFEFQPALPMRGVTRDLGLRRCYGSISTRTPHAGSDPAHHRELRDHLISTRTPHAGSDFDFLVAYRLGHISTRTPHAGSDARRALR